MSLPVSLPDFILVIVCFLSNLGIVINLFYSSRHEYKKPYLALFVIFVCVVLELILFVGPIYRAAQISSINNEAPLPIEYVVYGLSVTSSVFIFYLLDNFHKMTEKQKVSVIIISVIQVSVWMILTSLPNISIYLKMLANICYICIPAFGIHKITEKSDNDKNN